MLCIEDAKAARPFTGLRPSHHPCTTVGLRLLLARLPSHPARTTERFDGAFIDSAHAETRRHFTWPRQSNVADWGLPGTRVPLRWSPVPPRSRAAGSTESRALP